MINRHNIDISKHLSFESQYKAVDRIKMAIDQIGGNNKINLKSISEAGLDIGRSSILYDQPKNFRSGLKYYVDLGVAHFVRAIANEGHFVNIALGSKKLIAQGIGDNYGFNGFEWASLMHCAMIIRDPESISRLLKLPVWELIEFDEPFQRLFANYLAKVIEGSNEERNRIRYLILEDAESNTGLFTGMEESRYIYVQGRSRRMKILHLPLVNLYESILKSDQNEFNQQLEIFILEKRDYIIENHWEGDFRYWIDFGALAACSYAYDRGISIEVESEYIPSWVYKGEFDKSTLLF